MGVIALALYTHGSISSFYIPNWVKIAAGLTIAAGTYVGGWRIIRTLGQRIYKMQPEHGFAAQIAAGTTLYAGTRLGFPISTTHVVSGSVMGAGATRRLSAVRWGVAGQHRLRLAADAPRRRPRRGGPLLPRQLDLLKAFVRRSSRVPYADLAELRLYYERAGQRRARAPLRPRLVLRPHRLPPPVRAFLAGARRHGGRPARVWAERRPRGRLRRFPTSPTTSRGFAGSSGSRSPSSSATASAG